MSGTVAAEDRRVKRNRRADSNTRSRTPHYPRSQDTPVDTGNAACLSSLYRSTAIQFSYEYRTVSSGLLPQGPISFRLAMTRRNATETIPARWSNLRATGCVSRAHRAARQGRDDRADPSRELREKRSDGSRRAYRTPLPAHESAPQTACSPCLETPIGHRQTDNHVCRAPDRFHTKQSRAD